MLYRAVHLKLSDVEDRQFLFNVPGTGKRSKKIYLYELREEPITALQNAQQWLIPIYIYGGEFLNLQLNFQEWPLADDEQEAIVSKAIVPGSWSPP